MLLPGRRRGPRRSRLLARVLPDVDVDAVPLTGVPRRARWLRPVRLAPARRPAPTTGCFVARRGRLRRETRRGAAREGAERAAHQGPLQRRLGLATVHLDTTPGPVQANAAHRDAAEAPAAARRRGRAGPRSRATRRPGTMDAPADGAAGHLRWRGDVRRRGHPRPRPTCGLRRRPVPHLRPAARAAPVAVARADRPVAGPRLRAPPTRCCATGASAGCGRTRQPAEQFEPFNALHRNQMMENEPPAHTRLRSLVAKAFARGHIERLRPRVQAMADDLLDRGRPGGRLRPDRRLRRAAAGGRHRRAARRARGGPAPAAPVVGGIVRMYEYGRDPRGVGAAGRHRVPRVRRLHARPGRRPARAAARRPGQPPGRGRGRGRAADRRRAGRVGDPAAQRRPRGVGQRVRQRRRRPAAPPRRSSPCCAPTTWLSSGRRSRR